LFDDIDDIPEIGYAINNDQEHTDCLFFQVQTHRVQRESQNSNQDWHCQVEIVEDGKLFLGYRRDDNP